MDSRIPGVGDNAVPGSVELAFNTGRSTGIDTLQELGVEMAPEKKPHSTEKSDEDEKGHTDEIRYVPTDEENISIGKGMTAAQKVDDMAEIALYALHVEDDESLNPWTVRLAPFDTAN